jgi:transposase
MPDHLQVGIDFALRNVVLHLAAPDGRTLASHRSYTNAVSGYAEAKQLLCTTLQKQGYTGLDIAGEATSTYWLPFFLQLAGDADLAPYQPRLVLLNPRWVAWYKKSCGPENKTDATDAYYIEEKLRTQRPAAGWTPQLETLPLRCYTRLRFRLAQHLAGEKCYYLSQLFIIASAYGQQKPFSDLFGPTSRQVLQHWDGIGDVPDDELADLLDEWSHGRLSDPLATARKVATAHQESFAVPAVLERAVQRGLDVTLAGITAVQAQIAQVDQWIAEEAGQHSSVSMLATIGGLGPVFSSGIVAELGDIERFRTGEKWDKRRQCMRSRNLRDAEDAVAKIAGLWWPRQESGEFAAEDRKMSKAGNHYLRYYLIEAADHMRRTLPEYQLFYEKKYREASRHHHRRALVLTARKAVGLIVGLLHRDEPYRSQEERHTQATQQRQADA